MPHNDREPRMIVRLLIAARKAKGVTQTELAQKIGCGQPRISKIENGKDNHLRILDIKDYATALNQEIGLTFAPEKINLIEAISDIPIAAPQRKRPSPVTELLENELPAHLL